MNTAVEDVTLANILNTCQIHQEPNALKDHLLIATVWARDQVLVTNVRDAHQDKSNILKTQLNVCNQPVTDNIKSQLQLMPVNVENAKIANGQDTCQTMRELNVF